jgi:hypothetical protein
VCYSMEHFYEGSDDRFDPNLVVQAQKYKVDNVEYSATGAYYRFGINHVGGGKSLNHQLLALISAHFSQPSMRITS